NLPLPELPVEGMLRGGFPGEARLRCAVDIPGKVCDEVGFPGLAAIARERLLEVVGIGGRPRIDVPDLNGPAVDRLPVVKYAPALCEVAEHARAHRSVIDVDPIESPLVCFGVVEAQREALEVAAGSAGLELLEVAIAIPDPAGHDRAVPFCPGVGAGQGMCEPPDVRLEGTDAEIEIVTAATNTSRGLRPGGAHKTEKHQAGERAAHRQSLGQQHEFLRMPRGIASRLQATTARGP